MRRECPALTGVGMFRRRSLIACLALAALPVPGTATQPALNMLSQSRVPPVAGGQAMTAGRMVQGILSYSRWPARPATIRLCIAGIPRHGGALAGAGIQIVRGGPDLAAGSCDALYLGPMPPAARAAVLARMRGRPVVTIDEADPGCGAGAMFCLAVGRGEIALEMNLDAVSRSGVRIDPRVLRLGRQGPQR